MRRIAGFTYLPRQDESHDGVDGGGFWNIANAPVLQEVIFVVVDARFVRFTVLADVGAKGLASAAEISAIPAGKDKVR